MRRTRVEKKLAPNVKYTPGVVFCSVEGCGLCYNQLHFVMHDDHEEKAVATQYQAGRPLPLALWQTVPYLTALPIEIIRTLATAASCHRYEAGTLLFTEGDPVAGLFFIEEGTVKICRYSKEGREQTLSLFNRGDTFNDVAALDGGPNPATAIAFTDVIMWRIARPDLQQIVQRYPALAWALIESIARRTRHLVGLVQDLVRPALGPREPGLGVGLRR